MTIRSLYIEQVLILAYGRWAFSLPFLSRHINESMYFQNPKRWGLR